MNLVPGEGCLPGLQRATFLLCLHMPGGGEVVKRSSDFSLLIRGFTLTTSSKFNHLPKASTYWRLGLQFLSFEGHKCSVNNTVSRKSFNPGPDAKPHHWKVLEA